MAKTRPKSESVFFLQGWRATLIPLAAVPVSLICTFVLFPLFGFSISESASSKRNFHCEKPLNVSGPLCQLAKSLALLRRAGVRFDCDGSSGTTISTALFMLIRSDGNGRFVKDDVSCLGMPSGHT
jgi:AcrB/AcrD/AcrF family protein